MLIILILMLILIIISLLFFIFEINLTNIKIQESIHLVTGLVYAHDILWLQVEMQDSVAVHMLNAFADLTHEDNGIFLGQVEVLTDNTLKQLAPIYSTSNKKAKF